MSLAPGGSRAMRWPKRLFIGYFLFDMVVRSLISLTPYDDGWDTELAMDLRPVRLPATGNFVQVAERGESAGHESIGTQLKACAVSAAQFYIPWPEEKTRRRIDSAEDCGKFVITWLGTRLKLVGTIVGVDQDFPMFSPNVGTDETLGRLRLRYADGSERVVRTLADPDDLTCYSHWFQEKHLQAATKLERDEDARLGYCNWVAHQFPRSEQQAELTRIDVFLLHYKYPSPWDDARWWLARQTGPPADQIDRPFWTYDVRTRRGCRLSRP
ncbi:MAG: hypothetical protein WD176_06795 [Pirellulales bacterium]